MEVKVIDANRNVKLCSCNEGFYVSENPNKDGVREIFIVINDGEIDRSGTIKFTHYSLTKKCKAEFTNILVSECEIENLTVRLK